VVGQRGSTGSQIAPALPDTQDDSNRLRRSGSAFTATTSPGLDLVSFEGSPHAAGKRAEFSPRTIRLRRTGSPWSNSGRTTSRPLFALIDGFFSRIFGPIKAVRRSSELSIRIALRSTVCGVAGFTQNLKEVSTHLADRPRIEKRRIIFESEVQLRGLVQKL